MLTLYPTIKTYATHHLEVDSPHVLYVEECGDPMGIPVLIIHSGPGTGCEPLHRRFFDPSLFRIIIFDQRGAGRSRPHAELSNNTTQDLIEDMEKIRQFLDIDSWYLFGGGWGAALGLLYAQSHPEHVMGLLLRSVFLGRKTDIDWFYKKGANLIFPDYWDDFTKNFSAKEKKNVLETYHKRLTGADELQRMSTAKAWSLWQARCSALQPHSNILDHFAEPRLASSLAVIENYYFHNHCFIEENQIINNMDKIAHIPGYIVHGRYDIVTPLSSAWTLKDAWPSAELYIIRDAGHTIKEPGLIDAIVLAGKKIAENHGTSA